MSCPHLRFVLDTTVVSQLTATKGNPVVLKWLESAPRGSLLLPVGVVFEIQLGVEFARRNGNACAAEYERRLDLVLTDRSFRIVPPDIATARIRAKLAADPDLFHLAAPDPRSRRGNVGEKLSIAACALSLGAAVATLDGRDYPRIAHRHALAGVFDPASLSWLSKGPGSKDRLPSPSVPRRTMPSAANAQTGAPLATSARRDLPDGRVNGSLTALSGTRRDIAIAYGVDLPIL